MEWQRHRTDKESYTHLLNHLKNFFDDVQATEDEHDIRHHIVHCCELKHKIQQLEDCTGICYQYLIQRIRHSRGSVTWLSNRKFEALCRQSFSASHWLATALTYSDVFMIVLSICFFFKIYNTTILLSTKIN